MSVEKNSLTGGSNEIVEAPQALNSFFASIPTKGNVPTEDPKEEDPKEEDENPKTNGDDDTPTEDPKEDPKEITPKEPAKTPVTPVTPKEEEDGDEEDSVIHVLASVIGDEFELEGEFEDSEEGVKEVTKQIVQKSRDLGKKEGVEILYAKNPLLKDVAEHLEKGGSLISLIQTKQVEDFSKRELAEDDLEAQESMFRSALAYKGLDKDDIEDLVNTAKNGGNLLARAEQGKAFLVDKQKEIIEAQVKAEQEQRKAELQEAKETEDNIRAILGTGKIHGMEISSDVAKKLESFALTQDAKGVTARDTKWNNLTPEQWLTLDLIVMEDFKPVTNGKVVTPKTAPLKLRVKKAKPTVNLSSEGSGGKITKTGVDATLNKIGITDVRDLFNNK